MCIRNVEILMLGVLAFEPSLVYDYGLYAMQEWLGKSTVCGILQADVSPQTSPSVLQQFLPQPLC
jgi:hypothetical protein